MSDSLEVLVRSITFRAPRIHTYELSPVAGGLLPAFTAGAHIDLALANGLTRSYSLVNAQGERHRYVIGVQNDRASRGGSRWIHENVRAGDTIRIARPRNNFPLAEGAPHSVFFAGGIGITPILCMVRRLRDLDRSWQLHYCARRRSGAPFLDELDEIAPGSRGEVLLTFDEEPGGRMLDISAAVGQVAPEAHLYCCGPNAMLAAFESATADRPRENVHVEYFTAREAPARSGGFTIVLARSGREFFIAEGRTILDTLLEAGLDVPHSCQEGVCGTCETALIEGEADHRDLVLTESERASGKTMMICCSGANSARLVLDL